MISIAGPSALEMTRIDRMRFAGVRDIATVCAQFVATGRTITASNNPIGWE